MIKLKQCNLCGQSSFKEMVKGFDRQYLTDKQLFSYVKCLNCGLVFLNPQPDPDELRKYYPRIYAPYHESEGTFKYGPVLNWLKRLLRPSTKQEKVDLSKISYLDFGCGSGASLERLRLKHPNWQLYGLDNNQQACQLTKARGFEVYCGDLSEINLPENYFDIINLTQVIEHLNDPKNALKKLGRALKPTGQLIIQTPNFDSLSARLFKSYWYGLEIPRHLYMFNVKTLSELLNLAGLEIKRIEPKDSLMVEIRSFYYLLGRRNFSINPVVWKLTKPLSRLLALCHQSSIFTAYAQKK